MRLPRKLFWLFAVLVTAAIILCFSNTTRAKSKSDFNSKEGIYNNQEEISEEKLPFFGKKLKAKSEASVPAVPKSQTYENHRWIKISQEVQVYSAFWDSRVAPPLVRVVSIGLSLNKDKLPFRCHLKYKNIQQITYDVTSESLGENHGMFYDSKFIFCGTNNTLKPFFVGFTMIDDNNTIPREWLRVENVFTDVIPTSNLSVCVRPLYGPYDKIMEIAEFIAFYYILGISRFVFYDYDVSDLVREFILTLNKSIDVRLMKWDLINMDGVWAVGQLASIQDCVYRSAKESRYVLIADLDEFVIPKKSDTILDVINEANINNTQTVGSFLFRNAAFCLEFQSEYPPRQSVVILTQIKVRRIKKISDPGYRSKYIAVPRFVVAAGVHGVRTFLPSNITAQVVPVENAILHHYRPDTVPCLSANLDDTVKDVSARKFAKSLGSSPIINEALLFKERGF